MDRATVWREEQWPALTGRERWVDRHRRTATTDRFSQSEQSRPQWRLHSFVAKTIVVTDLLVATPLRHFRGIFGHVACAHSFPVIATGSMNCTFAAWVAVDAKRTVWVMRAEKAATWISTAAKAIFLSMPENAPASLRFRAAPGPLLHDVGLLYAEPHGGGSGIRTHGELAPTPVFKTGALNRSAIPPS